MKRDPELTSEAVIAFCRENLTSYKVPRLVEFRSDLPKNQIGKVLRRELRPSAAECARGAQAEASTTHRIFGFVERLP